MHRARNFLFFGVWIAVLPYLGFPIFWKNLFFSITGLAFCYYSFLLYKVIKKKEERKNKVFENFSENKEFINTQNLN